MELNDFKLVQIINQLIEEIRSYCFCNKTYKIKKVEKLFVKYLSDDNSKLKCFLKQINEIKKIAFLDLEMAINSDPSCNSREEIVLSYPGFYAIFCYRIAHELFLLDLKMAARVIAELAHSKTGIDIHPGAKIGAPFFIDHGTGVVIGETSTIGNRVRIYQGVTLGALSLSKGNKMKGIVRHPTIGDDVVIYANSAILGGDTVIGNNTTISSGLIIVSSIESNKIIVSKSHHFYQIDKKIKK